MIGSFRKWRQLFIMVVQGQRQRVYARAYRAWSSPPSAINSSGYAIRENAKRIGEKIHTEKGIENAVNMIETYVRDGDF